MTKTNNTNDTILVPKAEMIGILLGTITLARMHLRLIDLHEEESRLKKQHRAYLYVREYANQVCEEDKPLVASIIDSIFPGVNLRDPKSVIPVETLANFGRPECEDCPAYDGCKAFMDSIPATKAAEDVSAADERLCLMSAVTFDDMLADLCALGTVVDNLLAAFDTLLGGGTISGEELIHLMIEGEGVSDEVYTKWCDDESC